MKWVLKKEGVKGLIKRELNAIKLSYDLIFYCEEWKIIFYEDGRLFDGIL